MRIDKLLWLLRFSKTRSAAQALIAQGYVRLNGRRVERAAQAVVAGDIMVLPRPQGVTIVELVALPTRRGPASEAQSCYRVLDGRSANPIAADSNNTPQGNTPP